MGRIGNILAGAALAVSGVAVGLALQDSAAADVNAGDRLVYVPVDVPCRLADTRPASNVGPRSSPLGPGDTFMFTGHGPSGRCTAADIPADARALSLNVTALNASVQSFLTFWPEGPLPLAASLNPAPGQPPLPNAVKVNLTATGVFNVYNNLGNVDVVIDVDGYFAHHTHDDIYGNGGDADTVDGRDATWLAPRATGAGPAAPGPVCNTANCTADVLFSTIDVPAKGLLVYDGYVDLERYAGALNDHITCAIKIDGAAQETTEIQLDPAPDGQAGEETDCVLSGFDLVEPGSHTVEFTLYGVRDTDTVIGRGGSLWAMWVPVDGGTGEFFEDL